MRNLFETAPRSMRLAAVALGLTVGLTACTDAESSEAPGDETAAENVEHAPAENEAPPAIASGTVMTFYVDQPVSTDTHAAGDRFVATLHMPVHDADGRIALETGTESEWIVTQSSTEDGQALLAVELASIEVGGAWAPIRATVQEVELDTDNPDSNTETAAKIGVGTAAGALIGQILGKDTESTLKGAGVGAAVGTAVALATRGGHATIPAGSTLTVQLEDSLAIR